MKSVDEQLSEHHAMMLDRVIAWAGSPGTLAVLLDVTPQTVQSWMARGRISAKAAVRAEQISGGVFKARDLRPQVAVWWHEQLAKESSDA
jgi:DNA-binding transcriptional regulator YdaS (Cro superfamily)